MIVSKDEHSSLKTVAGGVVHLTRNDTEDRCDRIYGKGAEEGGTAAGVRYRDKDERSQRMRAFNIQIQMSLRVVILNSQSPFMACMRVKLLQDKQRLKGPGSILVDPKQKDNPEFYLLPSVCFIEFASDRLWPLSLLNAGVSTASLMVFSFIRLAGYDNDLIAL